MKFRQKEDKLIIEKNGVYFSLSEEEESELRLELERRNYKRFTKIQESKAYFKSNNQYT